MKTATRILLTAALLAATTLFANVSSAQGVNAGAAASTASAQAPDDLCVTNPNLPMGARIKPHKQFAQIHPTSRLKKLASRRKPKLPYVGAKICPPTQKAIPVAFVTPIAQPQQSLCQSAVGMSASVSNAQASAMLTQAGLSEPIATADSDDLAAAASKAVQANPTAAPAILAYMVKNINPADKEELTKITKAVYAAAPDQAAGITYAAVSTNPGQTMAITQALLASAPASDSSIIRQCAIDANPDLANQIATAAFVPEEVTPPGGTTIPPGTPKPPPDNSPV